MQAEELCNAKGVELPQDFAEAAMDSGLRTIVLEEYIRLQVGRSALSGYPPIPGTASIPDSLPAKLRAFVPCMLSAQCRPHSTGNAGGSSPSKRRVCMMQGKTFAGWLARTFPAYRDRLIEDPRFFFKVILTVMSISTQVKVESRDLLWKGLHFLVSTRMHGVHVRDRGGS